MVTLSACLVHCTIPFNHTLNCAFINLHELRSTLKSKVVLAAGLQKKTILFSMFCHTPYLNSCGAFVISHNPPQIV